MYYFTESHQESIQKVVGTLDYGEEKEFIAKDTFQYDSFSFMFINALYDIEPYESKIKSKNLSLISKAFVDKTHNFLENYVDLIKLEDIIPPLS